MKNTISGTTRKANGFTLIELLVVIAIIAILAAILFPVFAQAREKARQTSCLSNIKQISLGVMMYNQDYDETFPQGAWNDGGSRWYLDIASYTKNRNIRDCPSSKFKTNDWNTNNVNTGYGTDYGINVSVSDWGVGMKEAVLNAPAGFILLGDTAQLDNAYYNAPPLDWKNHITGYTDWQMTGPEYLPYWGGQQYPYESAPDTYGNQTRRPVGLHNDGANMGFADGHAKWFKIDRLIGPMPHGYADQDPMNLWDNY